MGKKNKGKKSNNQLPFVSVCTPTFNRRPFIPYMIRCFEHQTYPKDRLEWIIVDDGTDPIEDLVSAIPQVKYFRYDRHMLLGEKRNLMHTKCSGDILVYMDDDDYYPPERIAHAVETLQANPTYLLAGSSEMHLYAKSTDQMYQCGPYKPYHSTAATFAFRKELLLKTRYDDTVALSEEHKFTKGYTIPLIQLNPLKTILVFSHIHNSLDKERILETPEAFKMVPSRYTVDDFIKEPDLKQFYKTALNDCLQDYEPGLPCHKPVLLEQLKQQDERRAEKIKELATLAPLVPRRQIEEKSVERVCAEYEKKLAEKNILIDKLFQKIKELTNK